MKNKRVTCTACGKSSNTEDMQKSCGNCFACIGCEIYICPWCEEQVIIKPLEQ